MDNIGLRCYVDSGRKEKPTTDAIPTHNSNLVLVFDTETSTDQYQNLRFGSCGIWDNGIEKEFYLFYDEAIKEKELAILKEYADKNNYQLKTKTDFIEQVFYRYVFYERAICVGFNLPFDLSRLAIDFKPSRKYNDGFSFILSNDTLKPRIIIKSIDSKRSFIEFPKFKRANWDKNPHYKGYFVDLRTFLFTLTNESYNLANALVDFESKYRKIETKEHGKITPEYIGYNVNDTRATHDLYLQAKKRFELYGLSKEPNRLFSPASIGKAYHAKIGIKTFFEKNPDFPPEIIGYIMSTYYGGRSEVRIRKEPVKITYLDFTSMYPTLYALLEMDKLLKSERIAYTVNTREIQEFLDGVNIDDLRNMDLWKKLTCICRIKPDNNILPVRAKYAGNNIYTIGTNYLKSADTSLWYTLPDIIASKFLTGKTPIIEEAITFKPEGIQEDLEEIKLLNNITLRPEDDLIKKVIEERQKIKKEMKGKPKEDTKQQDLIQNILKIIANSTSYGIFIEINTNDVKNKDVATYGLDHYNANVVKTETEGRAFNPIIAVMLTSGAKLILAIAESLVKQDNGYLAYCDTDSVFISPDQVKLIQDFFKPLNPYDIPIEDMFKVEDDDNKKKLENVWFYGISAKRYTLYDYNPENKEIILRKYSSHGLGHLLNVDEVKIWKDILAIHYKHDSLENILKPCKNMYAISQLSISKYGILKRFAKLNEGKSLNTRFKPFNFIIVGTSNRLDPETKEPIIPTVSYINPEDKEFDSIPYMSFIDYKTGKLYDNQKIMDTQFYWKPLTEVIEDYLDHKEAKSEGDIGLLRRRHITIDKNSIHRIGKETNELEESLVIGVEDENYTEYIKQDAIIQRLLSLSAKEAQKFGISRAEFYKVREKYIKGEEFELNKKTINKLTQI